MRSRRPIWITGGVLVLGVVFGFLLMRPQPGSLSVQLIGRTNDVYTLLATNGTPYLYSVSAVPVIDQYSANIMESLPVHQSLTIEVVVPTNASRQIMVMYSRKEKSQIEHWIKSAQALIGIQRAEVHSMFIDLPE